MEDDTTYAEDIAIDPDLLDEEWLKQPGLYFKWAAQLADATDTHDKIWERLKVRRSELTRESKDHGATNAGLQEAYYREHKDHQALKAELADAKFQINMIQGAVNAMAHRKAALENLVKLWSNEYFSSPSTPHMLEGGKRIVELKYEANSEVSRAAVDEVNTRRKERKEREIDTESAAARRIGPNRKRSRA